MVATPVCRAKTRQTPTTGHAKNTSSSTAKPVVRPCLARAVLQPGSATIDLIVFASFHVTRRVRAQGPFALSLVAVVIDHFHQRSAMHCTRLIRTHQGVLMMSVLPLTPATAIRVLWLGPERLSSYCMQRAGGHLPPKVRNLTLGCVCMG